MSLGSQNLRLICCVGTLALSGCGSLERNVPLPAAESKNVTVLGLTNGRYIVSETAPLAMLDEFKRARERDIQYSGHSPANINLLALSGGSDNGAYGAGFLVGWSERGTRPVFKGVTGVSTGALIAPFAFLGRDYDPQLAEVFTTISQEDILKKRSLLTGLTSDAVADNAPLYALISKYLNEKMVSDIAREYRRGRLLFIGTTDLDAGRQVIWNIGAIAESGHPDAIHLIRRVLLASTSIPGVFPPVMLDISHAGNTYQELHVDGGAVAQTFLYPPGLMPRQQARAKNVRAAAYIIRNGKSWEEHKEVKRQTFSVTGRAISVMIDNNAVGDMYRIYATSKRDGIDFNLAYIESDFPVPHPDEMFDRDYMNKLFDYGRAKARAGYRWHKTPPGFAAAGSRERISQVKTPQAATDGALN